MPSINSRLALASIAASAKAPKPPSPATRLMRRRQLPGAGPRFVGHDLVDHRAQVRGRVGGQTPDRDVRQLIVVQIGVPIVAGDVLFAAKAHDDLRRHVMRRNRDERTGRFFFDRCIADQHDVAQLALFRHSANCAAKLVGRGRLDDLTVMPLLLAKFQPRGDAGRNASGQTTNVSGAVASGAGGAATSSSA